MSGQSASDGGGEHTSGARRWRLVRAHSDAVPASLRRLMSRGRPRTSRRRRRPWALAGVAVVLALLVVWALTNTPLLAVREVRVVGAQLASAAEIRQAAAVPQELPLLRVDRGEVAARVAAVSQVRAVTVRRSWPSALVVEVVERIPVAAVPVADGYALIDADGVVFHELAEPPAELPAVVLAEPGPDDPATRAALVVLDGLTEQLRGQLATLEVAGPAQIRLELLSGYTVVWGDETLSQEKARVATALLDTEAVTVGEEPVIDVSTPEVVVLR